ncbi:MAG TPA: hypothetical protein VG269_24695 [Tepidisphaeraceae bacterium]|jgi:hypothetical protein|nr:hypothetical protein [Tepidisphaeraceae bacterium]
MLEFVRKLLDEGRVRVSPSPEPPEGIDAAVLELDRAFRPNMAFEPPALVSPAAQWALVALYRGCQALVYREIEPGTVRESLSIPCPAARSPDVCYSVDLALRFLPDLINLARGIAQEDPLVEGLMALAKAWPLSSVGVPDLGELDPGAFIDHRSLRQLYVDRVIERADLSRLNDLPTRTTVRAALGAFPELAPRVAAALGERSPKEQM